MNELRDGVKIAEKFKFIFPLPLRIFQISYKTKINKQNMSGYFITINKRY